MFSGLQPQLIGYISDQEEYFVRNWHRWQVWVVIIFITRDTVKFAISVYLRLRILDKGESYILLNDTRVALC